MLMIKNIYLNQQHYTRLIWKNLLRISISQNINLTKLIKLDNHTPSEMNIMNIFIHTTYNWNTRASTIRRNHSNY